MNPGTESRNLSRCYMSSQTFIVGDLVAANPVFVFGKPTRQERGCSAGTWPPFYFIIACGVVAVAAITFLAFRLHLNLTTAALLNLTVIVFTARQNGFLAASIVSAVAVITQLYFLVPPVLTFAVADPENWVALAVFEYCALTISRLSAVAANHARVADRRRRETEGLYEISRMILLMDRRREPGLQLAVLIRVVFDCESVGLFDAESTRFDAAGKTEPGFEKRTRDAYIQDRSSFDEFDNTAFSVTRMGVRPVGALALRDGGINRSAANALAALVAVALERWYSFEKENRAEEARQSERLRTAVLDALAHDVKTPLTAIRAASSGLLEAGGMTPGQTELVSLIDKEADRLHGTTSGLLKMARLDDAALRPKLLCIRVDLLVRQAVALLECRLSGRQIETRVKEDLAIEGDEQLLVTLLIQLIDNAVKYSAASSEIAISAEVSGNEVVVSVHNFGPSIPPADLEKVFQRFYRAGGTAGQVSGTGLGLSIARKIAVAHRGRLWAASNAGMGTTFFLALPLN